LEIHHHKREDHQENPGGSNPPAELDGFQAPGTLQAMSGKASEGIGLGLKNMCKHTRR